MTANQRRRRYVFWRGSAIVLICCTLWMLVSSYCSQLTQ